MHDEKLYAPSRVAAHFGISIRHLHRVCEQLDLERVDRRSPDATLPRWRIPESTFAALTAYFDGLNRGLSRGNENNSANRT